MGPYLLILCHSGPIPPNLLTQLASPSPSFLQKLCSLSSSLTYTMGPYLLILWHSGPIPRDFMSQWACTPSSTSTVGTTIGICTTQTVQPLFLPYLHSGPIPPHIMTQWAYTPHLLTQLVQPSPSTLHKLCSLSSSLTYTMGPYLLIV